MKKAFQLTSFLLLRLEEMQNFPEIWSQISTNVICLQIFRNCKKNDQNIHLNYKFPSKFHILSMHACYDLHNQVVFQIICPSPRNLKFSFVCLYCAVWELFLQCTSHDTFYCLRKKDVFPLKKHTLLNVLKFCSWLKSGCCLHLSCAFSACLVLKNGITFWLLGVLGILKGCFYMCTCKCYINCFNIIPGTKLYNLKWLFELCL